MRALFPLVSLLACLAFATDPLAAAEARFATVDLKKVFDNYWKTRQADLNLKERAAEFDKKRKDYVADYQKAGEDYKRLLDSANDTAVALEERDRRKKSAEVKLRELQEIETSINQFDRGARTQLAELQRNMRDKIVVEIRDLITRKAQAAGYTAVFDTAAESITNTPFLVFSTGLPDLTDEIILQLNSTAPAGTLLTPETKK